MFGFANLALPHLSFKSLFELWFKWIVKQKNKTKNNNFFSVFFDNNKKNHPCFHFFLFLKPKLSCYSADWTWQKTTHWLAHVVHLTLLFAGLTKVSLKVKDLEIMKSYWNAYHCQIIISFVYTSRFLQQTLRWMRSKNLPCHWSSRRSLKR